jgi:iron complex outermembrane receptor protein
MAARYDELQLDRKNFNAAGQAETNGFARDYDWLSWRLGSVYKFTPDLVGYWQYSDAKDPIGSNIFLVNANQNFDLTDAVQWEAGIKSVWLDGRGEFTLAYFDIARDDILERFAVDSVTNIGGRDASGIEVSISAQPDDNWRLGLNGAYTEANFKRSTNMVTFAGNRPPNVPEWTANAWLSYDKLASLPLEVGVAAHYVGDRYGDNQNSVLLKNYALVDVFAAWKIRNYRLSAKINNLFDEIYAPWSEVSYLHQDAPDYLFANQLILGAPRSVRLSLEATF